MPLNCVALPNLQERQVICMPETRSVEALCSFHTANSLEKIKHLAELELREKIAGSHFSHDQLREMYQSLWLAFERAEQMKQLLDYFRQQAERGPEGQSPGFSIHESVHHVLHALQYEMPLSRITILKILPHDLPLFSIEPTHFEILLFELIFAARQAIGEKPGMITIEAGRKFYLLSENKGMSRLCLRVSHTGSSIDGKDMPFIFDPFLLPDQISEERLGPYIAKKIADLYHASAHLETSEKGTSFQFEFPLD